MLDWSLDEGVGFSKFISLGNEASLSESDFLKHLKDDPDTDAILIYLEKVNEGSKLLDLLKSITPRKPVVILKAGVSSYGAAAIMSHTGSLAPESKVFEAAVKQSGALMVSSVRKFFNAAKLLSLGIGTLDPIQRLVILTNGGGPSVIAADESGLSKSLSLVEFSESTKDELRKVLPKMASVRNPVDIIGDALAERYDKALDIICSVPEVDGVLVMLTPQMMTSAEETAKVLTKYKEKKKIMPVFIGGLSIQSGKAALIKEGLVNFVFSKDVITVLDIFANSASKLRPDFDQKKSEFDREIKQMPFSQTVRILNDYGVGISGAFINRKEDLESSLRLLGDGSYAMKAISPAASHKTDAGTVRLNVSNSDEAGRVWEELWTNPNVIGQVEGIAVQRMLKGREVIVGMKRDATFGPTILFGLGGVLAEAIKDTVLRVAPVEKEEALKMMHEIKGIKILEGMRGEPSVNFDLLADIIVNLSRLALEHPEIKEIDLNPVICSESEAVVVDARIMI
jgi:acetyltransferase